MFVKVLLLVAAVSADNRPIAANGDWEDCDNWTVGCPASSITYNAVIDKAITFDTSDANGHSEGTMITIEGSGKLTIQGNAVFIIIHHRRFRHSLSYPALQPNLKQTAGIKPAADTTGGLVAVFGGFIKTAGGSAAFFFFK